VEPRVYECGPAMGAELVEKIRNAMDRFGLDVRR
jgi:hypothetical protein